jgi:hypothetical protein
MAEPECTFKGRQAPAGCEPSIVVARKNPDGHREKTPLQASGLFATLTLNVVNAT